MATDQNLEMIISADSSGVKTGMNGAKESVKQNTEAIKEATEKMASATKTSLEKMMDSFKAMLSFSNGAMSESSSNTEKNAKTIGDSLTDAVGKIKGSVGGLSTAFSSINSNFVLLAGLTAGAGTFKEGIQKTKEFTEDAIKLSRAFNISATEASTLNVALGDIYSSSEDMLGAAQHLGRQLRNNEENLNKMGLRTRESSGEYRNLKDIMLDSGQVLAGYKEGTDRALAGQVLFGKGANEAAALMRLNSDVIDAAKEKQKELGLIVGVENVKALKDYKSAMNDVGDVVDAVGKAIGDVVMPIFTKFGEWLAKIGPAAVVVIKGSLNGLASAFWFITTGVTVLWETINAMVVSVAEPIRALAASIWKALQGDWSGAGKEISGIGGVISGAWSGAMDEILKKTNDTQSKLKALFLPATETEAADNTNKKKFVDPKEKTVTPEKSFMKDYDAELAELKVHYQEQQRIEGSFREFSKNQELEFWQTKLSVVKAGTEDEKTVRIKIAAAKLAIDKSSFEAEIAGLKSSLAEFKNNAAARQEVAERLAEKMKKAYGEDSKEYALAQKDILAAKRQATDQIKEIESNQVKIAMERNLDLLSQEKEISEARYQLGIQTAEKFFQIEQELENRRYTLQQKSLQDQLSLANQNPDKNPVEVEKLNSQLEELEIKHQRSLRQIQTKATLEQKKDWKSMFDSIQSSLSSVVKGLASGTMTMGSAIKTLMAGVADAVMGTLSQIAAKWIMQKVIEMVWGKTAALAGIQANAAVAGSGAYAATAAIPFTGPALAPAAAATAFAGAMSFSGALMSASQGYDIPAGVNPLTQLHQEEMVLPSDIAKPLRESLASGRGMGAVSSQGSLVIHARSNSDVVTVGNLKKILETMGREYKHVKV